MKPYSNEGEITKIPSWASSRVSIEISLLDASNSESSHFTGHALRKVQVAVDAMALSNCVTVTFARLRLLPEIHSFRQLMNSEDPENPRFNTKLLHFVPL